MTTEKEPLPGYLQDSKGLYTLDQYGNKFRPITTDDDGRVVVMGSGLESRRLSLESDFPLKKIPRRHR